MSARSKAKRTTETTRAKVKGRAAKLTGRKPAAESKTKKLSARAKYATQRGAAAVKHAARAVKDMAREALNAPTGFEAKATGKKRVTTKSGNELTKHAA